MKKYIEDYKNPNDAIEEFEQALSEYTGAPGVVVTDSCTHAIELGLRYKMPTMYATIPANTHISVPMTLAKLGIEYMHTDTEWDKMYRIEGSNVWDSAKYFEKDMFEKDPGQRKMVCLSFGHANPLNLGRGGAILTDNKQAYEWLKRAAYNGRDFSIDKWEDQKEFDIGYHYMLHPEECVKGLHKLAACEMNTVEAEGYKEYPDLREIVINK